MQIRKGPYGHFVIKKIEDIGSINDYTQRLIAENIPGHMLPLYVIPAVSTYELSYDFSGLKTLFYNPVPSKPEINKLRKALGDLFLSLCDLPDYLLSPGSVILDDKYVFTDDSFSSLSICFDPVKVQPGKLDIRSLTEAGIKEFLNSDSLSQVITPDETDGILYAVEQNDEDLLRQEARKLMIPLSEPEVHSELLELNEFKLTILLSLLSLIFMLLKFTVPSLLAVSAEAVFAFKTYKLIKEKPEIKVSEDTDSSRRHMLFGDGTKTAAIDALILTTTDKSSGKEERKAVYTDKAAIGSDRFLCDIYYSDKDMSAIHAQIKKIGSTYYVCDLSSDNSTFINNVRLASGQDYEIKTGQVLMCGTREFKIEII